MIYSSEINVRYIAELTFQWGNLMRNSEMKSLAHCINTNNSNSNNLHTRGE